MARDGRCGVFWKSDVTDAARDIADRARDLWGDEWRNFCRSVAAELGRIVCDQEAIDERNETDG